MAKSRLVDSDCLFTSICCLERLVFDDVGKALYLRFIPPWAGITDFEMWHVSTPGEDIGISLAGEEISSNDAIVDVIVDSVRTEDVLTGDTISKEVRVVTDDFCGWFWIIGDAFAPSDELGFRIDFGVVCTFAPVGPWDWIGFSAALFGLTTTVVLRALRLGEKILSPVNFASDPIGVRMFWFSSEGLSTSVDCVFSSSEAV